MPGAAGDLAHPIVGRGAAYADLDGDGDLDVVLTQAGERAVLLRNDQQLGHHWLRVKLRGNGTTVAATRSAPRSSLAIDGVVQRRTVSPSRSYQSQVELPVTFGLGATDSVEAIDVIWPDGTTSREPVGAVDRLIGRQKPATG